MSAINTVKTTHEQMNIAIKRAEKVIKNTAPWKDPGVQINTKQYYKSNHWISKNPEGLL